MSNPIVTHRPAESRFVVTRDDEVLGHLSYEMHGGTADLNHTFVQPEHREQGLGEALADEALRHFRADRVRVRPSCPFVAAYIAAHEDYQPLLEPSLTVEDSEVVVEETGEPVAEQA